MNRIPDPTLDVVADAIDIEREIIDRARAASSDDAAIAIVDLEWPSKAPFPLDMSVDMLAEPWLDDPDFAPDITIAVKRNYAALLRSGTKSDAELALLIYKHWPFSRRDS